jgi:hypothetical protein
VQLRIDTYNKQNGRGIGHPATLARFSVTLRTFLGA